MKNISRILLIALSFFSHKVSAQDFPGFVNSNYAGVSGLDLQPACIVDSRFILDANLIGFNLAFGNNYVGIKKEAFRNNFAAFKDDDFQNKYMFEKLSNRNKSVYLTNQIVLPSFMVNLNKKSALAFTWRVRNYFNLDGVEPQLAKLAYEGIKWPDLWNLQLTNKALSIQTMSWAEYGVTYGRVISDQGKHFFKGAVHLKLLQGLQAVYLFVDNLKYDFKNTDTLSLFNSDVAYGHSTNFDFSDGFKYKFVSNPGIGGDLGLVYEYRPDYKKFKYNLDGDTGLYRRDKNKYKLRIGFSATDIGSIKFQKGQYSNNFNANVSLWNVHDLSFTDVASFDDTIRKRFTLNTEEKYFSMNLPTAFSLQVDYHIWKDFYVNFTPFYALQYKNNQNKVHEISNYCLAPRWDHKWFGIFVPVAYNGIGNVTLGTSIRIGPLIVGTGNLIPLVGKKDFYGTDFHFLLKAPIMHRRVRDRDKDGVSDRRDKCIDVPGAWEFMGCPDRDHDHVEDAADVCPDEPGLPGLNGCPDMDGDGITDKQDACPENKGTIEFNGCPDKDGDKIIDKEDDCPDEAGLPAFKGCPDRDNDGVMDKEDKCPEKAGTIANKGCPEIKLHLIDAQGNILKTAIMTEDNVFVFTNLPLGSSAIFKLEGDDTELMKDLTILVDGQAKKLARSKDFLYRFESLKGDENSLSTMDVPEVPIMLDQKEAAIVKKAFNNLEFATAKDIIKPSSFASLNELAALLKKKPEWKIKLSGHTDNQGKPETNMKLSQKRTEAVKKYLMSKGIPAKRIKTYWFGQTKPIGDNNTEEGRQKNRRVEMLIVE